MDERDIVVAGDNISESGKTFFDPLDGNRGRERVTEVLQLLVGGGGGDKETVAVS